LPNFGIFGSRDIIELLNFGIFGSSSLLIIGTCPIMVYLYYSPHSYCVNDIVNRVQGISPIQIPEFVGLLVALGWMQIITCIFVTPAQLLVGLILDNVRVYTYWLVSFRTLW